MNLSEFKIFIQKRQNWRYHIVDLEGVDSAFKFTEPIVTIKEAETILPLVVVTTNIKSDAEAFIKALTARHVSGDLGSNLSTEAVALRAPTAKHLCINSTIKTPKGEAVVINASVVSFGIETLDALELSSVIVPILPKYLNPDFKEYITVASSVNVGKVGYIEDYDVKTLDDIKNMYYDSTLSDLEHFIIN